MIKKIFKWTGIIAISASIFIGLFFLNRHLKNEKLLFYKTGTNKKAILNTTWNMSYKEVERGNDFKLKDGINFAFIENGLKNLLNTDRINAKTIKSMNLWSYDAELTYDFFDDRLFRYRLLGEIDNPIEFDSVAVKNLELSYGKIKRDTTQFGDITEFSGKFLKDSVSVEYSQFDIETEKKKQEHRFLIEVTYQPIFNEIIKTANKEQQSIFQ